MICDTCGNTKAYKMQKSGDLPWLCDRCGDPGSIYFPDVYFKSGETYENLCDEKGVPIEFKSRADKAIYMKQHGLREAGDRNPFRRDTDDSYKRRTEVRQAIQKARESMRITING